MCLKIHATLMPEMTDTSEVRRGTLRMLLSDPGRNAMLLSDPGRNAMLLSDPGRNAMLLSDPGRNAAKRVSSS